jgi:hypothetical protein
MSPPDRRRPYRLLRFRLFTYRLPTYRLNVRAQSYTLGAANLRYFRELPCTCCSRSVTS